AARREKVDDFYAARTANTTALPWSNFAPPFSLGVLALVGSGVMMFFGRLNWPIFVAVFVGVVLIFSAETIIDGFAAP
ncbi:hypothetical protein ACSSV4_004337, partial [Roseovarius sp. MBR-154]